MNLLKPQISLVSEPSKGLRIDPVKKRTSDVRRMSVESTLPVDRSKCWN